MRVLRAFWILVAAWILTAVLYVWSLAATAAGLSPGKPAYRLRAATIARHLERRPDAVVWPRPAFWGVDPQHDGRMVPLRLPLRVAAGDHLGFADAKAAERAAALMSAVLLPRRPRGARCPLPRQAQAATLWVGGAAAAVVDGDEGYHLHVDPAAAAVRIAARSRAGAIHALATLLMASEVDARGCVLAPAVLVLDAPAFPHRGLLLDTAHHWQPVERLREVLVRMASLKSVGLALPQTPGLPGQYSTADVAEVVAFAEQLGVRVLPEVDVPGHAAAWVRALPEQGLTRCGTPEYDARHADGECRSGVLDPTSEPMWDTLGRFLGGVREVFPGLTQLHLGGDEVEFASLALRGDDWPGFDAASPLDGPHQLLELFERRLQPLVSDHVVVRYEEAFKPNLARCCLPPASTVLQFWRAPHHVLKPGRSLRDAAEQGYRVVHSPESHWYFDDRADFRRPWRERYAFDPFLSHPLGAPAEQLPPRLRARVLGGEGACWGECMGAGLHRRVWEPALAVAERLWTPVDKLDAFWAEKRKGEVLRRLLSGVSGGGGGGQPSSGSG